MNTRTWCSTPLQAFGFALVLAAAPAGAEVTLEGEVALDYYIAEIDDQGFEFVDAEFYAERIANSDAGAAGPLSLGAWLTGDDDPEGAGADVADAAVGTVPGSSSLLDFADRVFADDAAPGEYYAHVLLQDDSFPGTYEDYRTLTPRMLWRGGLEAVGPLDVYFYGGGTSASVDFAELRNNRIDARFTNDIVLTLYATHGFGPASSGYTLCTRRVSGLYAGDSRFQEGFDCPVNSLPDGEYTLHLDVAEDGGRAGYSTLSGPDISINGGHADDGYVYVGALDPWSLLALLLALPALARRRQAAFMVVRRSTS
jgi:hypothetical protein